MAFRITPILGHEIEDVIPEDEVWFDVPGQEKLISPRLGTMVKGSNGLDYVLVQANGTIAAAESPGTQVSITQGTWQAASGSGGWYAPVQGAPDDSYFWARRGTL